MDSGLSLLVVNCRRNPNVAKIGSWMDSANDLFKGIFSDFHNIFLGHESEDINWKGLFPKFQLIPILRFQVMHYYVCFIAPIDIDYWRDFLWKLFSFHTERISA